VVGRSKYLLESIGPEICERVDEVLQGHDIAINRNCEVTQITASATENALIVHHAAGSESARVGWDRDWANWRHCCQQAEANKLEWHLRSWRLPTDAKPSDKQARILPLGNDREQDGARRSGECGRGSRAS
jgi:NADH:ubiquinone oxidoreductase subunit